MEWVGRAPDEVFWKMPNDSVASACPQSYVRWAVGAALSGSRSDRKVSVFAPVATPVTALTRRVLSAPRGRDELRGAVQSASTGIGSRPPRSARSRRKVVHQLLRWTHSDLETVVHNLALGSMSLGTVSRLS